MANTLLEAMDTISLFYGYILGSVDSEKIKRNKLDTIYYGIREKVEKELGEENPFMCEHDSYGFATQEGLDRHLAEVHGTVK